MIDRLLEFFGMQVEQETPQSRESRIQHATAVLLVEIARADYERQDSEREAILASLCSAFDISNLAAGELLEHAEAAAEDAVSLHEFTSVLHAELSYAEKTQVVEMLWRIALADRNVDKYEDYMIGKIAELLYVARGDVIRIRNRVYETLE